MRPIIVTVLVLACACRATDTMTPRRMTLAFEPSRITPTGQQLSEGRMSCDVDAVVRAHGGTQSDFLQLLQIVSTFFDATGARVNSTSATPSDWFGTNRLNFDERLTAHRTANGPGPVKAKIALGYVDLDGAYRSDTLTVDCQ